MLTRTRIKIRRKRTRDDQNEKGWDDAGTELNDAQLKMTYVKSVLTQNRFRRFILQRKRT